MKRICFACGRLLKFYPERAGRELVCPNKDCGKTYKFREYNRAYMNGMRYAPAEPAEQVSEPAGVQESSTEREADNMATKEKICKKCGKKGMRMKDGICKTCHKQGGAGGQLVARPPALSPRKDISAPMGEDGIRVPVHLDITVSIKVVS